MDILIKPSELAGTVKVPPSKSYTHRAFIAAALAGGGNVSNPLFADDTYATLNALKHLGSRYRIVENAVIFHQRDLKIINYFDAFASGSTLRFLLPVFSLFCKSFTIKGTERLIERLVESDFAGLIGLDVSKGSREVQVKGSLVNSDFILSGKNTSQIISGMIFCLPFLADAKLKIVDIDINNPYLKMTLDVGRRFGINYDLTSDSIQINPNNFYKEANFSIEGDFSQASNWFAAAALNPGVLITGLNINSYQGDRAFLNYIKKLGYNYHIVNNKYKIITTASAEDIIIDITNTPDLGPVLASLASVSSRKCIIRGIKKLKLKESDRMNAIAKAINTLGGKIIVKEEEAIIYGKNHLNGNATVDGANDHRIIMALAAISSRIKEPYIIKGADAVSKSYPHFFNDFQQLKGQAKVL